MLDMHAQEIPGGMRNLKVVYFKLFMSLLKFDRIIFIPHINNFGMFTLM
jgi:hypothetical protein